MKSLLFSCLLAVTLFAQDSMLTLGESIYKETCISCHNRDGTANTDIKLLVKPRDLTKTILDTNQTFYIIKYGAHYWGAKTNIMPAFESIYSDKEIKAISLYISKTFNPDVEKKVQELYAQSDVIPQSKVKKMLKRGGKIYKRNCSWCHGIEGKGDGEASRNPKLSIFPYDLTKTLLSTKQMFLYVKYGGNYWGTHKDDMPNWSKKYDDFTLKSVVKYVNTTFKGKKDD